MSGNTYGKLFKVTTYGESHGKALGCIIDGCPPQLEIYGDPNGIGIDISFEAKAALKNKIPFFLIADINHVKIRNFNQKFIEINNPNDCFKLDDDTLPVLHHDFPETPTLSFSK